MNQHYESVSHSRPLQCNGAVTASQRFRHVDVQNPAPGGADHRASGSDFAGSGETQRLQGDAGNATFLGCLDQRLPMLEWHAVVSPVIGGIAMGASDGHDSLTAPESLEQFIGRHEASVTVNLLSVNTFAVAHFAPRCASFSGMSDTEVDSQKVARRLRAVMGDLELETVSEFAKFLHAERSQVSNWLQGYNLPPPRWMNILCRRRKGLTLDWIYRGVADAVPTSLAIKLEALLQGLDVPLSEAQSASEPEAPKECQASAPRASRHAKPHKETT